MKAEYKLHNPDALLEQVHHWKSQGKKLVFTNGVFDILHLGHVDYLAKAKALGDKLIVGINSDESVRRLNKGPERPLNPEYARAAVVNALKMVDATVVFTEDTPLELILKLMPDVLVKGGDYDPDEKEVTQKTYIVGSREVLEHGGVVTAIPLVPGYSTTGIISRMK